MRNCHLLKHCKKSNFVEMADFLKFIGRTDRLPATKGNCLDHSKQGLDGICMLGHPSVFCLYEATPWLSTDIHAHLHWCTIVQNPHLPYNIQTTAEARYFFHLCTIPVAFSKPRRSLQSKANYGNGVFLMGSHAASQATGNHSPVPHQVQAT